ncbi:MAG: hypothetical protein IH830_13485 [Planctomycetes bacterium]|nr:hypothetical protein [Planctomycetota bacterium]
MLQCVVENEVKSVVDLLLAARNPNSRSASEFVEDVLRLRLCALALDDQFHLCLVLHYWPKTPGAKLVCGYDSALELVYEFGCDLYRACIECESIEDQERDDILWEIRANGVQALLWKQEALQELADWAPPRSEVSDRQLVREWDIVQAQFRDEVRQANGKVLGLVDDAHRGRLRRVTKQLDRHVQTTPPSDSDCRTLSQLRDEWKNDAPWLKGPEFERSRYAVFQVAGLCFDLMYVARHPELCLSSEFAESMIAIVTARCALSHELLPDLDDWPKTPGTAFVKWVQDSAVRLIFVLSYNVVEGCYGSGFLSNTLPEDLPGETHANSPRVTHWKESALQHIREQLLPPRTEYPDWLFWREAHVLMDQFQDELRRARGDSESDSSTPPPLSDIERKVLELLVNLPASRGMTGKEIIHEAAKYGLSIGQGTITRHVIPKLRAWYGVSNRPGVGYYLDSEARKRAASAL